MRTLARRISVYLLALAMFCPILAAQQQQQEKTAASEFDERQARLRGSITPEREWWDLQHYHLSVEFLPATQEIRGSNQVAFKVLKPSKRMQIDLQPPLEITQVKHGDADLEFVRDGNVYWIDFVTELKQGTEDSILISYQGKPQRAKRPPWDGGVSWSEDEKGNPFIVTTSQGIGASIWWPNKDHGYDEPDLGMNISLTVPESLSAVANGRLQNVDTSEGKKTFHWLVTHPINNYSVNANIGNYVHFSEKYQGEAGELDLDYWVDPLFRKIVILLRLNQQTYPLQNNTLNY